jgi:hypothetical protein
MGHLASGCRAIGRDPNPVTPDGRFQALYGATTARVARVPGRTDPTGKLVKSVAQRWLGRQQTRTALSRPRWTHENGGRGTDRISSSSGRAREIKHP